MRGGMALCISVPGSMAEGGWSAWLTRSPVLEAHLQSHETLILRNASSTASVSLSCAGKATAGRPPGGPSSGGAAPAAGRPVAVSRHYSDAVPDVIGGDPQFRSDRGEADQTVAATLAAFAAGTGSEQAALTALASSRLLVPIVAVASGERDENGAEKSSEMAAPAIVGADGRRALPAFTSMDSLRRWKADARPVPVPALGVWQSAAGESQAVIIDIAGPVQLAVEGARLAALAGGAAVPPLHQDPDVHAVVAAVAAARPVGIRIRIGPPQGAGDLTIELAPADPGAGDPIPPAVAEEIANEIADRLADRLAAGIALVVRRPAARP